MPIIIKAKGSSDSTNDLIRRFKKVVAGSDLVQRVRDRRYNQRPSQMRKVKKTERRRLMKKVRSLKDMKNVSPQVIERLTERLNS